MSYSRRQLYAMGEPLGDSATRLEAGGKRIYGSGGGGSSGTQTVEQTNVPSFLRPQFEDMLGRGIALSKTEYQPFTGQRQADFTNLQNQAFTQADQQGVAGQIGAASGLAGAAGLGGLASRFDPMQTGQFDAQTAAQYMDPFMQNVVGIQQREAQRQADIAGTQRGAQAVRAGAFGGSRQAIVDAEAQRNLAQQMGDIQATGSQAAFRQAQEQFGRDQQLQEQSRQFGAEFGQRGLSTALQGAQALGSLGQQQFGQEMDITRGLQQAGGMQQQQEQRRLDQQFGDFQAQRDFDFQQLGFLSDLLRGTGSSSRSVYQPPTPSAMQNIAGLGTAAAGVAGMMAKGGEVKSYADGGITGLLDDQQLAQRQQTASPMGQLAAAQEAQRRDAMRQAVPADMPRDMDMTEQELMAALQQAMREGNETKARVIAEIIEERRMPESGIAGIAPDSVGEMPEGGLMAMAGGGMVSFPDGGSVRSPYEPRDEEATSPFGDFYRGLRDTVRIDPKLAELRDRQIAARQGLFEALTPTEKAARAKEMQSVEQEIANLQGGRQQPAAPAGSEQVVSEQAATDAMRNQSRAAQRNAAQARMAEQTALEEAAAPADSGIAAIPRMGFDAQAAMADEFGAQQGIAASLMQGADEAIAAQEAAAKERGVFGEAREKRLKEEKEGLAGKKDEARSMALIQAGLSILSADPSRGALSAIGQGAIQGLGAYKGDIKDLEKNRERILDKMDEIDGIRHQETMADGKERRALIANRNKAIVEGQKLMANTMSRFTDINREDANTIAEQTFRRELASMPSGEERILRALGDGDVARGFELSKQLGAKPADLMKEFTAFVKASPMMSTLPQEQQMAAFFRAKMALGSVGASAVTLPPGAPVAQFPNRS